MEDSDLNPKDKELKKSNTDDNKVKKDNKVYESSSLKDKGDEDNLLSEEKDSLENEQETDNNSLFRRILENGFDGITTNPNYKLLALLVILLINLSLFFLVGNLGKSFLKESGILS